MGLTTIANTAAIANMELPKPSLIPIATASAVTVAEWDDGIPPDPISCLASQRFSLYLQNYEKVKLLGKRFITICAKR